MERDNKPPAKKPQSRKKSPVHNRKSKTSLMPKNKRKVTKGTVMKRPLQQRQKKGAALGSPIQERPITGSKSPGSLETAAPQLSSISSPASSSIITPTTEDQSPVIRLAFLKRMMVCRMQR